MKLTKPTNIAALSFTGKDPCVYWGERGFGCRVYKSGRKKWVLAYRASGRKRLFTIGEFPAMSHDKAEDFAAAYRLQIDEGSDPAWEKRLNSTAVKQIAKPSPLGKATIAGLCDAYVALHAKNKRSGSDDERLIARFIRPQWGKLRADRLTRQQITMQHASISSKTPVQANRVLAILKTMMNKASLWGFVPENHANPAMKVPMNKEHSRERFVSVAEFPLLVAAIESEPNVFVRGVLWLYLLTGARKSELLEARWSDIDTDRLELLIPRPKQGKPHIYPLTTRAMEVLNSLPKYDDNPFVFPGLKPGARMVNISKPWNRVRVRAKLDDVHLHDLRRSVGSWLAEAGFSLISIGKVLGHRSPRTTQIYARLTDGAARRALESHSEKMLEVLHAAKGDN